MSRKMKAAIIGGGVIGGGWAARFLLHGWDVSVYDPDPEAFRKIEEVVRHARLSLPLLADVPMPIEGILTMVDSLGEAVEGADWVQESVPEVLEIKHKVYEGLAGIVGEHAVIGSSTSCYTPTQLRAGPNKSRSIVVTHPFNPVYLLPLVELVPGNESDPEVIEQADSVLTGIGMKVLVVRKEIEGHIADRLLEAVWREGLWLINDGIATTSEVDDAIRHGFGLRWAQMGLFETYRIAGGEEGMAHFIEQFGPTLEWPVSKLMDVPDLDDALVNRISEQSDEQSGRYSIRELERIRDNNLVGMLRSLKERNWAAGAVLKAHEKRLKPSKAMKGLSAMEDGTLKTYDGHVPPSWIDQNGHVTESRYLAVASDAADAFLEEIGAGMEYIAGGRSFYTAESHLIHLDEAKLGESVSASTQIIFSDAKRIHMYHTIRTDDSRIVATCEQMFLHVDMQSVKACDADQDILDRLAPYSIAHAKLKKPDSVGRFVGEKKYRRKPT